MLHWASLCIPPLVPPPALENGHLFTQQLGKDGLEVRDPFVRNTRILIVGEAAPSWRNRWGPQPRKQQGCRRTRSPSRTAVKARQGPQPRAQDSETPRAHMTCHHCATAVPTTHTEAQSPSHHTPLPPRAKLLPGRWAGSPESRLPGIHVGNVGTTEVEPAPMSFLCRTRPSPGGESISLWQSRQCHSQS